MVTSLGYSSAQNHQTETQGKKNMPLELLASILLFLFVTFCVGLFLVLYMVLKKGKFLSLKSFSNLFPATKQREHSLMIKFLSVIWLKELE